MNKFNCERCGFQSKFRSNFIRHLKRKYPCKPILKDISIQDLKQKYNIKESNQMDDYVIIQKNHIDSINQSKCITINKNKNNNKNNNTNSINQNKLQSNLSNLSTNDSKICVYCKEKFNSRQSLSRHMKHYCKIKNIDYWKKCFKQSETARINLEKEKQDLMKQIEILLTKVGNNNVTTINNNQQNNIIIRNFGEEDLSYLTDIFYKNLITNNTFSSIPTMVKEIHCNENHPENMNIKIVNKKAKFINVYKGDKWQKEDKKTTIQKIVNDNFNLLDSKYHNMNDSLTKDNKLKYVNYKAEISNNNELVYDIFKSTEKILENV